MPTRRLLLLALLLACTRSPKSPPAAASSGPLAVKEVEPNDSAATAQLLRDSCRVSALLKADTPRPDEDFYRIDALGPTRVARFDVSGIPGVDLKLELLDRDGNPVAVFNNGGDGEPERIPQINLGAPYVVKVTSTRRGSGGAYTASLTLGDATPGFEAEPNNRAVDATALEPGTPIKGLLADKADEDWYRVTIPLPPAAAAAASDAGPAVVPAAATGAAVAPNAEVAAPAAAPAADAGAALDGAVAGEPPQPAAKPIPPAVVRVDVTAVEGVRLQVEVANEAQAVFFTGRGRDVGDGLQVRNLALRPGETTYYVVVKSAWVGVGKDARRGANDSVPYTLTVAAESITDETELEPNDEPAKATPMTADSSRKGFLAPKGDIDYFQIAVERPSLLKIELSGVDRIDSLLSVAQLDPATGKEEVLLKANDGGVREGELLVNVAADPARPILVRVEAAPRLVDGHWERDQENAEQPYRLTVSSRPDMGLDEREPNNTAARANPIEIGKPVRGLVHPKKDVDFYRLDLSASPVKVPLRIAVSGILKVDISLGLHRVGEDGQLTLVQRAERAKGEQPELVHYTAEPGVYLIEIRDTHNAQSNFLDAYTVRVDEESRP